MKVEKKKIKDWCRNIHVVGLNLKEGLLADKPKKKKKRKVYLCCLVENKKKKREEEEEEVAAATIVTRVS